MNRSLIVAKIVPAAEREVAAIWAESDETELPGIAGVRHRSLYRLGDLYVHLLETDQPGAAAVERARQHPEFARVSERLSAYITPYLATWASPRDAQAHCFYEWAPSPAAAGDLEGQ
jgi:cyclase